MKNNSVGSRLDCLPVCRLSIAKMSNFCLSVLNQLQVAFSQMKCPDRCQKKANSQEPREDGQRDVEASKSKASKGNNLRKSELHSESILFENYKGADEPPRQMMENYIKMQFAVY